MRTSKSTGNGDFSGGKWWRFSDYELRDGCVQPTRNARLEAYDAWASYRLARLRREKTSAGRDEGWIPPYAELANLCHDLDPALILAFCRKYGLPGSLLHQVQVVTLAPRWVLLEDGQLRAPGQRQFIRINTGWVEKQSVFRPSSLERSLGKPELAGALVPKAEAPEAWARVGVLRRDLRSPEMYVESVGETWGKYFPSVPPEDMENFPYPAPQSDDFWRAYAEPYPVFLGSIQALYEALWELTYHKPRAQSRKEDAVQVRAGVNLLHAFLAPASASIIPMPDGTFAQQWVCNSLLSAFAMMALHDMTEGRRMRSCVVCERMFVSQHPAARYCRGQCRWQRQKQTQRNRAKSEKRTTTTPPKTTRSSARKDRRK